METATLTRPAVTAPKGAVKPAPQASAFAKAIMECPLTHKDTYALVRRLQELIGTSAPASTPFDKAPNESEETKVVQMYRSLSRWEKNSAFILLQSIAWGRLTDLSDNFSWEKMQRTVGLVPERKGK